MTMEHLMCPEFSAGGSMSSAGKRRTQRMCQSVENIQNRKSPAVPPKISVAHMV
jgi:hypothetical protein